MKKVVLSEGALASCCWWRPVQGILGGQWRRAVDQLSVLAELVSRSGFSLGRTGPSCRRWQKSPYLARAGARGGSRERKKGQFFAVVSRFMISRHRSSSEARTLSHLRIVWTMVTQPLGVLKPICTGCNRRVIALATVASRDLALRCCRVSPTATARCLSSFFSRAAWVLVFREDAHHIMQGAGEFVPPRHSGCAVAKP